VRPPSGALLYTEHHAPDHFGRYAVFDVAAHIIPFGQALETTGDRNVSASLSSR